MIGLSGRIRSLQRGTIAIAGAALTNTASISAVVRAKCEMRGGMLGGGDATEHQRAFLTSATVVTMTRENNSGDTTFDPPWLVIERY